MPTQQRHSTLLTLLHKADDRAPARKVLPPESDCSQGHPSDSGGWFGETWPAAGRPLGASFGIGIPSLIRQQVKTAFGLTNADFDAADRLIEQHPYLSGLSGRELPLKEISLQTIDGLLFALVAWQEDDLLSEQEWAGLRGIVEVMRPVCVAEDYAPAVARYLSQAHTVFKDDIVRSILRNPAAFSEALKALGQSTLSAAFLAVWPPA